MDQEENEVRAEQVTFNPRCAGNVLRYHTWPTLVKQTVADHTFHVLRIYYECWPGDFDKNDNLFAYILYHDMSEIATGDIPFPVKKDNPALKIIMDNLEKDHAEKMGRETGHVFSDTVKTRIKLCDLCEMYEFAVHEMKLGNKMAEPVRERVSRAIHSLAFGMPEYGAIFDYMNRINK